ncbi:hypothetical protein JZ751_028495 [Albula glossodonta]|uniref:Uncharacterized protein n=1 Tax=Albula glossodonta TaxID=121402 RepID=A0A8T2NMJ0_9TELE|nr:hypothetical protein JZ751_028495 [Albula glossodonta]
MEEIWVAWTHPPHIAVGKSLKAQPKLLLLLRLGFDQDTQTDTSRQDVGMGPALMETLLDA